MSGEDVSLRAALLREAERLITGDRNQTYGSPTQNFTNTAEIWTAQMRHKLAPGVVFEAHDVAALMIGLKLARLQADPKKLDTWVDLAGYAACGGEAAEAA